VVRVIVRVTVRWIFVAIRMSSDDGCAAWSIALGLNACKALAHGRQSTTAGQLTVLMASVGVASIDWS